MKARRLRAFSMMELLLALGMVAMLTLSLYASMRVGFRARKTAQATVAPTRAATIAMDMICRDLESVPAPTGILAGPFLGMRQSSGTSEAHYIQFCCVGSDGNQPRLPIREGARLVELMLRTDVNPPALVRRVTRNLLANTQMPPEEEILCRGVRTFAVQYFDGTYWQSEWDSTAVGDVLPMAVQILIELEPTMGLTTTTDALPNRIVRVIPLACAQPIDVTSDDSSSSENGSSSTGTGGTGGTGGAGGGR